jgi:hypothetical protein
LFSSGSAAFFIAIFANANLIHYFNMGQLNFSFRKVAFHTCPFGHAETANDSAGKAEKTAKNAAFCKVKISKFMISPFWA